MKHSDFYGQSIEKRCQSLDFSYLFRDTGTGRPQGAVADHNAVAEAVNPSAYDHTGIDGDALEDPS
jgi:hypothetical protein